MSEGTTPPPVAETPATHGYNASSLVVSPRPDEVGFPLREDEFQILCEGEVTHARASRDLYIGACIGALVGLVSVLATTDWTTIWQPQRRVRFLVFLLILCSIGAASAIGICIHQSRVTRTRNNSPYSRLQKRIC